MYQLLIVDDEASLVDSLALTLPWHELGITAVFKAYSGFEAVDILTTNSIDIMLTDIHMPGMSGMELLELVHRSWKKTKCILISGHAEFSYAQQAIRHNTYEYLLKPISDADILQKVSKVVELLQAEREENKTYHQAVRAFEENLPKIRGDLLNELLQGRRLTPQHLAEKLEMLKISVAHDDHFALMLVRLEEQFTGMDFFSLSLMEYAIGNMAEEIFADYFEIWLCKDVHDYLVFVVTLAENKKQELKAAPDLMARMEQQFQLMASQLQLSIKHYLKGCVSILVSKWGEFPRDINKLYHEILSALRSQVGNQGQLFISVTYEQEPLSVLSLYTLYEPPLLVHLLESGDWQAIHDKLGNIFSELGAKGADSREHLIEVFFSIYSAFSSFAHKSGRVLADMIGAAHSDVSGLAPCRSIASLRSWTFQTHELLQNYLEHKTKNERESAVQKMQTFVQKHLVEDVSLQAISNHMYMHPVHLSRIYKTETGENLSDFVYRLKMEKAAALLTHSSLKNYEIALQLGYQHPNYFIKVFKKFYSLTPQEFRSKLAEGK